MVYQQDGAPPHFALPVREYLNRTFPNMCIGRGLPLLWAARSHDLTPVDFFLWGFVKDKAYSTKVRNLVVVKQQMRGMCHDHCGYVTEGIHVCRDPFGIMF